MQPSAIGPTANVFRRIEIGIDAPPPGLLPSERRDFEFKRLPIGVDDEVQEKGVSKQADSSRQGVRLVAPVWCIQFDAMPLDRLAIEKLVQSHIEPLDRQVAIHPERNKFSDKAVNIRVLLDQAPVKPRDFVVLAEGVVVSALGAPYLITHQQHRCSYRKQRQGQEVLDLPVAQPLDFRIGRRALDTAIPAEILIRPVAVAFAVNLVVLAIEGYQIVECETVVTGYEIDALLRLTLFARVDVRTPRQAEGHARGRSIIGFKKSPAVVAEAAVPFLPAIANSDQFYIGEDGIGFDVPEDRRRGHRAALRVAGQDRGEIEAEAIDVHVLDPIAQTVD